MAAANRVSFDVSRSQRQRGRWCCYLLHNAVTAACYCGMTIDLDRRLRQHNREICGGARATARGAGAWRPVLQLDGFVTQREALQAEWRLKHPSGRRRSRVAGRGPLAHVRALLRILRDERWTARAERSIADTPLTVRGDARLLAEIEDNMPIRLLGQFAFAPLDTSSAAGRRRADGPRPKNVLPPQ